jgi:hypothetical protein
VQDDDARLQLAYAEALRALERQQQTVSEFATRSGTLVYAAAIVAAFLGSITLEAGSPSTWGWIAVGALVGVGALHVVVLWPRWTWRFRFEPQALVDDFVDRRATSLDEMRRELVGRMQMDLDANLRLLRRMGLAFQISNVLFVVETFAWLVAVAGLSS